MRSLRSSSAARCNNCSPDRYVNATEIVTNQPNFCLADFQPKYRANRDLKLRLEVMQSKNNSTPPMHMRRHLPHDQSCLPLAAALCTGEPLGAGVHLHVTCTIGVGSQFGSQLVKVLERLELTQTQTLGCIKSSLAPHELPTPNSQAGSVTQQSGRRSASRAVRGFRRAQEFEAASQRYCDRRETPNHAKVAAQVNA